MKKKKKRILWHRLFIVIAGFALVIFLVIRLILWIISGITGLASLPAENTIEYDINKFKNSNGFKYYDDFNYTTYTGIDVSSYQGDIDWKQVADCDIDFAIVRCGYTGMESGKKHTDEKFEYNIEQAKKNGIKVGVYYYSQATTEEEVISEANYVLKLIKGYKLDYPVAFDMEGYGDGSSRTDVLSKEEKTDLALKFCETIQESDYKTLIYGNDDWLKNHISLKDVKDEYIWYASYSKKPNRKKYYVMWQYSCTGTLPGIDTAVDMDIYMEKKS